MRLTQSHNSSASASRPLALRCGLFGLLAGLFVLAGCSGPAKQKWLAFFFDGVPVSGAATNNAQARLVANSQGTNASGQPAAPPRLLKPYIHPPYAKRQCADCHQSKSSQRMAGKGATVCFNCHKDTLIAGKVKHQPVENGECVSCHNPHQAFNTNLLSQLPPALCGKCHDPFPKTAKSRHQPVENGECVSCHNPHSSDNKKLLVKPGAKLCYECHEEIPQQLAKAKVKHQPVENGE